MFVALIVKLGLAPFHFWLPRLVSSLRAKEILILLVWQKIGPLFILTFIPSFEYSFKIIIGILRAGVGRFLGLKQTQWKQIFTFSSIRHLG
jgi:NADH-ubiquinone oxidoreductase chain 2